MPPKVVAIVPANGSQVVDPAKVTEIRVTFDQPMDPAGYSWIRGAGDSLEFIGQAHWTDSRTCVQTVKLQPGEDYRFSINSRSYQGFCNLKGEPAEPYPVAFSTLGKGPQLTPARNRAALTALKTAIDRNYSQRDRLKVDWDRRFADFSPRLEAANTPRKFGELAAELLAPAQDQHLWLTLNSTLIPTDHRPTQVNFNLPVLHRQVPGWKQLSGSVVTGSFGGGIAYLLIASWDRDDASSYKAVFQALDEAVRAKASGMIIDVRPNGGGDETFAQEFAGCFVDTPRAYAKDLHRQDGQTIGPFTRTLEPNATRPTFHFRLAVLMGPGCVSSTESFLMMMKQVSGCRLIGTTSGGSSGNPKPFDLGNGVVAFIPSWIDLQLDGSEIEGVGIRPDIRVEPSPTELATHDPILDAALACLRDRGPE